MKPSHLEGTDLPRALSVKQLRAIDLRAEGNSWDSVSRLMEVTPKTIYNWRQHPLWAETLENRQREWAEEYESKFVRMMPKVADTHDQLLGSKDEAIRMRACDSAHTQYGRIVKEKDQQKEIDDLKAMVLALTEQLAQQRAG